MVYLRILFCNRPTPFGIRKRETDPGLLIGNGNLKLCMMSTKFFLKLINEILSCNSGGGCRVVGELLGGLWVEVVWGGGGAGWLWGGECRVEMSLSGVDTRVIARPMHVETEELSQCTAWQ